MSKLRERLPVLGAGVAAPLSPVESVLRGSLFVSDIVPVLRDVRDYTMYFKLLLFAPLHTRLAPL
jgi:hypothetical protein